MPGFFQIQRKLLFVVGLLVLGVEDMLCRSGSGKETIVKRSNLWYPVSG